MSRSRSDLSWIDDDARMPFTPEPAPNAVLSIHLTVKVGDDYDRAYGIAVRKLNDWFAGRDRNLPGALLHYTVHQPVKPIPAFTPPE